jgi:hypothetical protein
MKPAFGYPPYAAIGTFPVGALVHLRESVCDEGLRLGKVSTPGTVEFRHGVLATFHEPVDARQMTEQEIERYKKGRQ